MRSVMSQINEYDDYDDNLGISVRLSPHLNPPLVERAVKWHALGPLRPRPHPVVTVDSRELYTQIWAPDSGPGHLVL